MCVPNMSAHLASLFSLVDPQSFTSMRMYHKCMVKPDRVCWTHAPPVPACFVYPFHPLNINTYFHLHFGTNLGIQWTRMSKRHACTTHGQTENNLSQPFKKPALCSTHVSV